MDVKNSVTPPKEPSFNGFVRNHFWYNSCNSWFSFYRCEYWLLCVTIEVKSFCARSSEI